MKHHFSGRVVLAPLGAALCAVIAGAGLAETASAARTSVKSSITAKINGSDGPIHVPNGTIAYLSWTATNVDSCTVTAKLNGTPISQASIPTTGTDVATPPVQKPANPLSFEFVCKKGRTTVKDTVAAYPDDDLSAFKNPQEVTITGYTGAVAMEPFLSQDGKYLFFNNANDTSEPDTRIFYAEQDPGDTTGTLFTYKGEVSGVNNPGGTNPDGTNSVEVGPTVDNSGLFYFASSYLYEKDGTRQFTFAGQLGSTPAVPSIEPVYGLTLSEPNWFTMDTGVSPDGAMMYYSNAYIDPAATSGSPPSHTVMDVAQKTSGATGLEFSKLSDSATLLKRVNGTLDELNYAPQISNDGLELFFTRAGQGMSSPPQLFVARRNAANEAFNTIQLIVAAPGFVEGPSLSADGRRLYYHKAAGPDTDPTSSFKVYMLTRP